MTNKRYLLIPLGLSFDNLIDAAIVATKRENSGNTVHDTADGTDIDHKTLLNVIRSVKKPKQQIKAPIQQGFFDGYYKILPLLIESSYERDGETYPAGDDNDLTPEPFAAFAIIFKDGKIAATTRTDGSIGLPGGKVDQGENAIDCAKRESEEEGFKVYGSGKIAHRDLVEGRPVVWVVFDDATMLTSYKERHRGISPIWTDVANVANKFGNRFLLNLKP